MPGQYINVAINKPAFQRSTYYAEKEKEQNWSATNAVDGIIYDHAYDKRLSTHTNNEANKQQWWIVDLKEEFRIDRVRVYARKKQSKL